MPHTVGSMMENKISERQQQMQVVEEPGGEWRYSREKAGVLGESSDGQEMVDGV